MPSYCKVSETLTGVVSEQLQLYNAYKKKWQKRKLLYGFWPLRDPNPEPSDSLSDTLTTESLPIMKYERKHVLTF